VSELVLLRQRPGLLLDPGLRVLKRLEARHLSTRRIQRVRRRLGRSGRRHDPVSLIGVADDRRSSRRLDDTLLHRSGSLHGGVRA
jgi:hypothetical protein